MLCTACYIHLRWVELFPSTKGAIYEKLEPVVQMAAKPDAGYKGVLKMRGLPWQSSETDIVDFFKGYKIDKRKYYHSHYSCSFSMCCVSCLR
jgi:hypothetical protein